MKMTNTTQTKRKNKYLVLGSAGQIGTPLCQFLESKGHDVLRFDVAEHIDEDLRWNTLLLKKEMQRCDFVYFLAFDVGGSVYLQKYQNTFDFVHNNGKIMTNTFELLKETKKPFIFASSQMSNMLHSPYGVCKAMGEVYTKALNGINVKLWNVYGPEGETEKTHVITDFARQAIQKPSFNVQTDGQEERQFLYVDDCCEALYALANKYNKIPRDKELHITSFEWTSIERVAELVTDETQTAFYLGNEKDKIQGTKNEPNAYPILLYWKPKISLQEGIEKMLSYERARLEEKEQLQ